MKMINEQVNLSALLVSMLCVLNGCMVAANGANNYEDGDRSKLAEILELLRSDDVEISFYGKVVDQVGLPVSGAKVELDVSRFADDEASLFGGSKSMELITDANGMFTVDGERGSGIYIQNIGKLGYDGFGRLNGAVSFNYGSEEDGPIHIPNIQSPIMFVLRKMGVGTFCINNTEIQIWIDHETYDYSGGYDFIKRFNMYDLRRTSHNGVPLTCDLLVRARFETNSSKWTLIYSSGNTNGGVQLSDQLLYEAPETGYQRECSYVPVRFSPVTSKYIYIKSRDPVIYSRLEIGSYGVDPDFVRVSFREAVTNPYGERNFELHSELSWEMITHLTAEVENAFRAGKRPVKPDIKAMIEAARGD